MEKILFTKRMLLIVQLNNKRVNSFLTISIEEDNAFLSIFRHALLLFFTRHNMRAFLIPFNTAVVIIVRKIMMKRRFQPNSLRANGN